MSKLIFPVSPRDHIRGPETARLTLVEYGDFQCPACAAAHPRLQRLRLALPNDFRWVFRHFPLTEIHEYALLGALAAEAAGRQGRFWEMHDLLYRNQELLGSNSVLDFGQMLGLDMETFQSDLASDDLKVRVRQNFLGGVRSGVNGTPGFFLNSETYRGSLDLGVFLSLIEQGSSAPAFY